MSLFSSKDINTPKDTFASNSDSQSENSKQIPLLGNASPMIHSIIGNIENNITIHYTSFGSFSMHELLGHLLSITGNAKVFIATWAMTENPCRAIHSLIANKSISELHLLFDYKIKERSPQAIQLAEGIATSYKYTKCHAKSTVILNDNWGITIIGSANYTRNPRIERGLICCNKSIAEFDANWISNEINNQNQIHTLNEPES